MAITKAYGIADGEGAFGRKKKTCMELGEVVRRVLDEPAHGDDWKLDGLEASFDQNARLFFLLDCGGGMQNKMGNAQAPALLWRCDCGGELSRDVSYSLTKQHCIPLFMATAWKVDSAVSNDFS